MRAADKKDVSVFASVVCFFFLLLLWSRLLDLVQLARLLFKFGGSSAGKDRVFNLFASSLRDSKNHQTGGFSETLGLLVWPNFPWI